MSLVRHPMNNRIRLLSFVENIFLRSENFPILLGAEDGLRYFIVVSYDHFVLFYNGLATILVMRPTKIILTFSKTGMLLM